MAVNLITPLHVPSFSPIALRMSCPHTSQQNGKAERVIRSTNNIIRCLMLQASLPSSYWVEALHTATYLFNRHPTKTLDFQTPYFTLYGVHPSYSHLRVFGCLCYPNLSSTATNKLSPHSTMCVFLGYPLEHKGYQCLDLSSNRIIISRHVIFDETQFPFANTAAPPSPTDFDFLSDEASSPLPIGRLHSTGPAGSAAPASWVAASGTGRAPPVASQEATPSTSPGPPGDIAGPPLPNVSTACVPGSLSLDSMLPPSTSTFHASSRLDVVLPSSASTLDASPAADIVSGPAAPADV